MESSKPQLTLVKSKLNTLDLVDNIGISELNQSEQRFAFALHSSRNDGLWDWDLKTNQVFYSSRWKAMLGYEDHELENSIRTWHRLVHIDDKSLVQKKFRAFLNNNSDTLEVEMRMRHKAGHYLFIRSRALKLANNSKQQCVHLIGTNVDITARKKTELSEKRTNKVLEMIAKGTRASAVYDEIALMFEERHPGLRCSLLQLKGNKLRHGGAPSLPKAYCEAVDGLEYGPNVGSCGTSTFTGKRVIVECIETDPKWAKIKHVALPHGMRCCWSEPIKSSSGKVLGALGMYYNHTAVPNEEESQDLLAAARLAGIIMERERNHEKIRNLAYTDELTGLSSRAYFSLNIKDLIKTSAKHKRQFSLLYIDLDNFKSVNDTLGHDIGDFLLREIAQRLNYIRRDVDFIARLSGDEFCIITRDLVDAQSELNLAQRCLNIISKPINLSGRKFIPTCSIGIAQYPENGDNDQTLLKAADTALYAAKNLGRNRYAFYDEILSQKADYRFKVEQLLREAIEAQQLTLVYQPQFDFITGEVVGVEALSRWFHPQLGNVSPARFINTAENIGMIKPLTQWVLESACKQAQQWAKSGHCSIRMAVNISPSHFMDDDLVPLVKRVLEATQFPPGQLKLEVTEGLVQTNEQNLATFKSLKQLGVMIAIDDFGTGYSSFASLKHLSVDFLKIDKYFVDDIATDDKARLLIGSMIEMGHILGYDIIAEGIETAEQFNILRHLGCDIAQGFLFSKPVDAEEVSMLLSTKSAMKLHATLQY